MQRGRSREAPGRRPGLDPLNGPGAVAAIVPAGGTGRRAQHPATDQPKQFRSLAGRPVFHYAVDALARAGCSPIVVVVPEEWVERAPASGAAPDVRFTVGGLERQDSVANGLDLVVSDRVVVHDAARPFLEPELVLQVLSALDGADAALAAVPVDETLKLVEDGAVVHTVDRRGLWRAQTPAAFETARLRDAMERARVDGFVGTDGTQLIERYGGRVAVVPGARSNLKITFSEDFEVAEAMMRRRAAEVERGFAE